MCLNVGEGIAEYWERSLSLLVEPPRISFGTLALRNLFTVFDMEVCPPCVLVCCSSTAGCHLFTASRVHPDTLTSAALPLHHVRHAGIYLENVDLYGYEMVPFRMFVCMVSPILDFCGTETSNPAPRAVRAPLHQRHVVD